MELDRRDTLRVIALEQAVKVNAASPSIPAGDMISGLFTTFFGLLIAAEATRFAGTVTVTDASGRIKFTLTGGDIMTNMTIDDTITIVVNPEDDHGDDTPDQLVWAFDDNGAMLTPSISADTHTVTGVPVAEGTVNFTAADPSSPNLTPFSGQIVIGAGVTSQLAGAVVVNAGANQTPPTT